MVCNLKLSPQMTFCGVIFCYKYSKAHWQKKTRLFIVSRIMLTLWEKLNSSYIYRKILNACVCTYICMYSCVCCSLTVHACESVASDVYICNGGLHTFVCLCIFILCSCGYEHVHLWFLLRRIILEVIIWIKIFFSLKTSFKNRRNFQNSVNLSKPSHE